MRLAASVSGKIADGDDAIASNANVGTTCRRARAVDERPALNEKVEGHSTGVRNEPRCSILASITSPDFT